MPSHYTYKCNKCSYTATRYRNVRRCPNCGGDLHRVNPDHWHIPPVTDVRVVGNTCHISQTHHNQTTRINLLPNETQQLITALQAALHELKRRGNLQGGRPDVQPCDQSRT